MRICVELELWNGVVKVRHYGRQAIDLEVPGEIELRRLIEQLYGMNMDVSPPDSPSEEKVS